MNEPKKTEVKKPSALSLFLNDNDGSYKKAQHEKVLAGMKAEKDAEIRAIFGNGNIFQRSKSNVKPGNQV